MVGCCQLPAASSPCASPGPRCLSTLPAASNPSTTKRSRFQPVHVPEPTVEETYEIMLGLRERYEAHHKLRYTDEALRAAAKYSSQYISDRFLPDKVGAMPERGAGEGCGAGASRCSVAGRGGQRCAAPEPTTLTTHSPSTHPTRTTLLRRPSI